MVFRLGFITNPSLVYDVIILPNSRKLAIYLSQNGCSDPLKLKQTFVYVIFFTIASRTNQRKLSIRSNKYK